MSYFTYQGKELFYQEAGQGEPCLFLHGNTASSRMFTFLLPLYTQHFRVILLDFLGNGKSQRLDAFPYELWTHPFPPPPTPPYDRYTGFIRDNPAFRLL